VPAALALRNCKSQKYKGAMNGVAAKKQSTNSRLSKPIRTSTIYKQEGQHGYVLTMREMRFRGERR